MLRKKLHSTISYLRRAYYLLGFFYFLARLKLSERRTIRMHSGSRDASKSLGKIGVSEPQALTQKGEGLAETQDPEE